MFCSYLRIELKTVVFDNRLIALNTQSERQSAKRLANFDPRLNVAKRRHYCEMFNRVHKHDKLDKDRPRRAGLALNICLGKCSLCRSLLPSTLFMIPILALVARFVSDSLQRSLNYLLLCR